MSLGIYVQVPFCQTKCTYCNFHTGVFPRNLYSPYVSAVCREIATSAVPVSLPVDTIYIGGGTPSLLEPAALERMLECIRGHCRCEIEEVTLEADPETVTAENARAWGAARINRISLGAQSFNDQELQAAGRMHRRADTANAVRWLRDAGFANVSVDLIAGLPHQTRVTWEDSVGNLLRLRPEHVSIYMMEIDEGSRLGREVLSGGHRYSADLLPADDAMADFYEDASERLAAEGYEHYEISNWALPGYRSRHNLKYWRREPYLGFGAGAHSFDGHRRWSNAHDPAAYVSAIEQGRSPIDQEGVLTPQEELDEELFLGLRQLEGINLGQIESRYKVDLRNRVKGLEQQGLVEFDGERVRLAAARLTVSNEVFVELLGQ
ncbi:MAG: radical SAM family heme chaperone HemW [Candidatus Acidiferrales bacterium]